MLIGKNAKRVLLPRSYSPVTKVAGLLGRSGLKDVPGLPMNLLKARKVSTQETKQGLRGETAEEAVPRMTEAN
jgi:hypothetical protein